MNAISPALYFEPADGELLNRIAIAVARTFAGRQTAEQALLALGKQLDATAAAGPDDTDRAYLDAVGWEVGVEPERGFVAAFQRRIDIAEQDALQDAWVPALPGESPLERPAPNTWHAVEDACQKLLERVRAVSVEVPL